MATRTRLFIQILTTIRRETLEAIIPVSTSHDVLIVSGHHKTAGARRD